MIDPRRRVVGYSANITAVSVEVGAPLETQLTSQQLQRRQEIFTRVGNFDGLNEVAKPVRGDHL
ncbi:hypothetical protein D3C72_2458280 [compost metagenome]